jgi:hypothetical protein
MILMPTFTILKNILKARHVQIVSLRVALAHQNWKTDVEGEIQIDNSSSM